MKTLLTAVLSLAFLASVLTTAGCGAEKAVGLMPTAEHKAAIQTIADAEGSIADEHLSWAAAIAQQGGAQSLPDLSKATQDHLRQVLTTQLSQ